MRNKILAALAATALALSGGLTAVAGPAAASSIVPIAAPIATARPGADGPSKADVPALEAYEKQMRSSGQENASVRASEAAWDKVKGNYPADKANPCIRTAARQCTPDNANGKAAVAGGKAGSAKLMSSCATPCYYYNGFGQIFTADPADAGCVNTMTGKPYVDNSVLAGAHSLGQGAVLSANGADNIEYGWIVDKTQRADGNPILFASHKINGSWKGYQTAWVDYVDNPATPTFVEGAINLGAGLPKPVMREFCIQQTSTAFWVWYGDIAAGTGDYVAYVPKSRWTPGGVAQPFNAAVADFHQVLWFSEYAGHETEPCGDLGTGTLWNAAAVPPGSPPVTTWDNYSVGGTTIAANWSVGWGSPGITGVWGANASSGTTGETGGPGYNSAGTAPGTTAAC